MNYILWRPCKRVAMVMTVNVLLWWQL